MSNEYTITGRAWLLGDNIDTDQIISGKHLRLLDYNEMARHALEIPRPDFVENVSPGDVIVAGKNFGAGSSREEAPQVLKVLGVGSIIAESFARIFYRNAFNIGLPAIILEKATEIIQDGETVVIDLVAGILRIPGRNIEVQIQAIPEAMMALLRAGGAVARYKAQRTQS